MTNQKAGGWRTRSLAMLLTACMLLIPAGHVSAAGWNETNSSEEEVSLDASQASLCILREGSNQNAQDYTGDAAPAASYLEATDDGGWMRVQAGVLDGKVFVEYYDKDMNRVSTKEIKQELPIFGGFYASADRYFVLTGQENPGQSSSKEVYRLTRYDKEWNRQVSVGLFGANIRVPFSRGSARMAEADGNLYIRTCGEKYTGTDGVALQTSVTIVVSMKYLKVTYTDTEQVESQYGTVKDSHDQFVQVDGSKVASLDLQGTNPGTAVLNVYDQEWVSSRDMLEGAASRGAVSLGGLAVTDSCYVAAGTLANQGSTRNIFVSSVPGDLSAKPTMTMITTYASGTASAGTPHLVTVNGSQLLLLWNRGSQVNYCLLNAKGQLSGKIYTLAGALSDCSPVVKDGKVFWYTWQNDSVDFYTIPVSNPGSASVRRVVNKHISDGTGTGPNGMGGVCLVCGKAISFAVPEEYQVLWSTQAGSSEYHEGTPDFIDVGTVLRLCCKAEGDLDNEEYCMELSNTTVAEFADSDTYSKYRSIRFLKTGTVDVRIYPRYNTKAVKTIRYTCAHDFSKQTVVKAATCTAKGLMRKTCSGCGVYTEAEIPVKGHTVVKDAAVAPDCTHTGLTSGEHCSACGKVLTAQMTVQAKGHVVVKTPAVEADCEHAGTTASESCQVCGAVLVASKTVPALGHDYVASLCTRCGKSSYDAPELVTVTNLADRVKITWKAVDNAPYYRVFRKTGSSGWSRVADVLPEDCADPAKDGFCLYEDTTALTNTTYTYTVRVLSADRKSYVSSYDAQGLTIKYLCTPVLSAVKNVSGGMEISWKAASGVSNYRVFYLNDAGGWSVVGDTTATKITFKKAVSGQVYTFTVRGIRDTGSGYITNYNKTGISLLHLGTIKPTLVNSAAGITVSWTKIAGAAGYSVYRKLQGAASYTKIADIPYAKTVSYVDKDASLVNGTAYTYAVKPYNGKVVGYYSAVSVYRLAGVSLTSLTNTATRKMVVKWPKDSKVSGYQFQYDTVSTFTAPKTVTVSGNSTVTNTVSSLTKGKTYYVRIRTYKKNSAGTTYYSDWSTVKSVKIAK